MLAIMPSLIELLHQAQKELTCPTCGRTFLLSEIRPRGHSNSTIMLQAVCSNNHFPIVLIFIPPNSYNLSIQPIQKRDLLELKRTLETFEGDFLTLWPTAKN